MTNIVPSAPTSVGIAAGDAVVDLWWSAPDTNTDGSELDDLEGFNIYQGTVSGSYDPAPINGSYPYSGLGFTDINVTNGQTYYYIIKAVDYSGNESPASVEVSDTPDVVDDPPLAPANPAITEKAAELLLTWDSNYETDLAGYNVYKGTSSGSYSLVATLGAYEWYVDQNVSAGQTYYYVVTAEDYGGNESGYSNEVSGEIGQGDIWIISPTSASPAILNYQNRVQIRYNYNAFDRLVSEVYLGIINSDTGEIVYTESEWKPPLPSLGHEPYFIWNGKYSFGPNEGICVLDGWYDTKLYLKVFEFLGTYAETSERRNIQMVGCISSMIKIIEPNEQPITDNNFTFNSAGPGVCNVTATGTSGISSENPKLEWSIDTISGSTLTSNPQNRKGPNITFTFTGLPSLNSEFSNKTLTLTYPNVSGTQDTQTVQTFFSKNALNNPGSGDPNWYYYWSQTEASSGNHQYDPATPNYGYYIWGDPHFYIGSPASGINSWTGHDGIDTFAETCLHENQHKINYQTWWVPIGGYNAQLDQDGDYVLDSAEPALNLDPTKWDTDGDGWNDEHDIAYDAEFNWSAGRADSEDWSNPGHQSSK
ncbi:MAG TPA: hypothetical protein ENG83_12880 [Nitrospirae bacterium]|nr:hypothetical protein [Nitrospirota bacterium]HDZ02909.1 hypothetical protein [Nitrospirota bacterium]